MSLDSNGLNIERFEQLINTSDSDIQSSFGGGVDLSSDSILGVLESIVVNGEADLWELLQGVYDSTNLLAAEGSMLDNLALLVGYIRFPASRSRGSVLVTAKDGTTVPQDFIFNSINNDEFFVTNEAVVTATSCQNTRLYVGVLDDNTFSYNINIDGNLFTYISQSGDSEIDILVGLESNLASYGEIDTNLVENLEDVSQSYLYIEKIDSISNMFMSAVTYLTFDYVTTPVACRSVEFGEVRASEGTINIIKNSEGLETYSINNPVEFTTGSNIETDLQLRDRVLTAYTQLSAGTIDTIHREVSSVQGVIAVKLKENITMTTDGEGLPPKAYKVIVYGGEDVSVAEAIWRSKPAGIQPWSDFLSAQTETITIEDYNSQEHVVLFTRPNTKYVWLKIQYSKYSEESFTGGGEEIMKETAAATGQALTIGEDVIPKRFIGPLYKAVKGLEDIIVTAALSDDINTPPLAGEYVDVRVLISDEEITDFSAARVEVSEI